MSKVPPVATLENTPPSDIEGHLSAWELGEMEKFREVMPYNEVLFNTCGYEGHLEVGSQTLQTPDVCRHTSRHQDFA